MTSLDAPDPAVVKQVERAVKDALGDDRVGRDVERYFAPEGHYAGATFNLVGSNPANRLTAGDLFSVTLLSIRFDAGTVRKLLEPGSTRDAFTGMLTGIRTDLDLWADDLGDDLQKAGELWHWLRLPKHYGVGWVTAGKILARKRPRLIPVYDSVVQRQLGGPPLDSVWMSLRACLMDEDLRGSVEALRPDSLKEGKRGEQVPTLRLLDVALWMRGKRRA